ncbi:MAG: hypothetical protein HY590_07370 [Candidatus Omnitrophica bacterium]|nr:hypothetical protein [Candidatus Omnitrophota bacterium]
MIKLNLLPPELKKKKGGMTALMHLPAVSKIPLQIIYLYAAGGLAAIYTLVFLVQLAFSLSLNTLKGEWEKISPKQDEIRQLVKEYETLVSREKAVQGLLVDKFLWSRKLYQLSQSFVPGVWLQEMALEERTREVSSGASGGKSAPPVKERILILSGSAVSPGEETAVVGRFIRGLKENRGFFADFTEVEVESIKRRPISTLEVMDFKVICTFREGILP